MVTVDFDDGFSTKMCTVDHIIIVVYINDVDYRGSSEMSQIHTQWSHLSRLLVTVDFDVGFNTKMCSVDHIIIAKYINDVFRNVVNPHVEGASKVAQSPSL